MTAKETQALLLAVLFFIAALSAVIEASRAQAPSSDCILRQLEAGVGVLDVKTC